MGVAIGSACLKLVGCVKAVVFYGPSVVGCCSGCKLLVAMCDNLELVCWVVSKGSVVYLKGVGYCGCLVGVWEGKGW